MFQSLNGAKHLTYLLGLRPAFVVLNIHPRVPLPRCPVDLVAGTPLAARAEEMVTDAAQVRVAHTLGIRLHLRQYFRNTRHDEWYHY